MNIINKKLIALSFAAVSVMTIAAQEASTGYFMENYNMRWQMNPAMDNRLNYVGFPGLGNVSMSVNGNLNVKDIVYPYNGKTVLFTNPNISANKVLENLHDKNNFSISGNVNLLQVGFKAFGGYNNVAINARTFGSVVLPKSIFSLLKEGVGNNTYEIKDVNVKVAAYAEIALNHSRDINWVPGLRAGVSLKFLLPFGFAEANFDELTLELGENNWKARSNANMRIGMNGMKYKTEINDRTNNRYVSGVDADDYKFGVNGFGFALDLGATYKWNDYTFSLALTDLGVISVNSVQEASTNGTKYFETENHVIGVGDHGESWDKLVDDLSPLYELSDNGNIGSASIGVQGKLRAGVDYKFALYDKLHFGLMNTTCFSSIFPSTEFRISANVEPIKGIAASVSAAAGTYGANYGFLLSLGNKGFNFLLGMDYAALKMDKHGIPLSSNCDFHMGINFPF